MPITIVVLFPLGLNVTFVQQDASWAVASALQVAYAWGMTIGLMGLFRRFLAVERRGVRYLSDSAYWLYLAHLPQVIAGQDWMRTWDLPASIKFTGLCVAATALLLVSYQLLLRHSPIGWLLNGKRSRSAAWPGGLGEPMTPSWRWKLRRT